MESKGLQRPVKCFKCRYVLVPNLETSKSCSTNCDSYDLRSFIFLNEDRLPDWIKIKVEEEQWTKGKLNCSNCACKVGSFDFVAGRKCECGSSVLPPVHFITSQVDIPIKNAINVCSR